MARIFLSAGEASGEQYAVQLIAALRAELPRAEFYGLGGRRMEAAGFHRIVRAEDVAVMGITEILRHVPHIYREYRRLRRSLAQPRADLAIFVDFPDVNLALAKHCRRLGIPTLFFVSPQVWAWKQYRLARIRRDIDRMLVIFPFEEAWYRERGVDAAFVGHPLAELPLPGISREAFAAAHALDPAKQWIGLLPGSRSHEIALNLPEMLRAARLLDRDEPGRYQFVLPTAPTLAARKLQSLRHTLAEHTGPVVALAHDARATLHHAQASIISSGTATVEAALIGTPFVVVYRLTGASYAVARRFVKVPHIAMPNLIAGRRVVPELIQNAFTAEAVTAALRPLLHDTPARETMQQALTGIRRSLTLQGSAIAHVAEHALALLSTSKHPSPVIPSLAL